MVGASIAGGGVFSAGASADATCTKVASPSGSDSAPGTVQAPFRTASRLADSLGAGEVGCLRGGTYSENLRFNHGGASGAPITLRSYAGERARLVGRLYVPRGSDYVTVANLDLNGANSDGLPSPTVNAVGTTFSGNDVTNDHSGICFDIGNATWGRAAGTSIASNRIHDCGRIPSTNLDHGIYVSDADDTHLVGNVIYNNADRGVQLYPDAQRTTVSGNVIDGNGEGVLFAGDGGKASSGAVIQNNVITNSKLRNNVESYYPAGNPVGQGNVVQNNCISGGARDSGNGGIGDQQGFSVANNLIADPQFVDRAGGNYSLRPGSPCAALLAGGAAPTTRASSTGGQGGSTPPRTNSTKRSHGKGSRKAKPSKARGHVSLSAHFRHGVLVLGGSVRSSRNLHSAGVQRATIQVLSGGAWHVLSTVTVKGGHFAAQLHLPASLHGHSISLHVVVASVASSPTVHLRAA